MRARRLASLLPLALAGWFGAAAQAQTETRSTPLYRCGPEGRELRSTPCPEDAGRAAQTVQHEQPGAAQQREARERARLTQAQADKLERERLAREAAARPAQATGIHGVRPEPAVGAPSRPASQAGADKKGKSGNKKKAAAKKPGAASAARS